MRRRLIFACLGTLVLGSVAMAADLEVDVETTIDHNGTFQDFTIPSGISTPSELQLFLKGGDGGKRVVPGLCTEKGGRGAKVFARFPVGTGAGELRPGGRIRFIVGDEGDSNRSNNVVGAGGGGGTAVLYTSSPSPGCGFPSTSLSAQSFSWVILAVAGGGGGAYTSGVCGGEDGTGGQSTEHGTSGTGDDSFRGEDGNGGQNGGSNEDCNSGGPGGGAFTGGLIIGCDGNSLLRAGGAGLCTGGSGGLSSNGPDGGFGYGGGGSGSKDLPNTGGGAGGGFSGGGGGEFFGRGGGGGSFLAAGFLNGSYKENGGETKTPDPGYATYVLGAPTSVIAICREVTLDLVDGAAQLLPTDVDGGSLFPDDPPGATQELRINKGQIPSFFSAQSSLDYDCSDLGDDWVSLIAILKEGTTFQEIDYCVAPITVRDPRDFTFSALSDVAVTADAGTCSKTVTGLPVPSAEGLCDDAVVSFFHYVNRSPAVGEPTFGPITAGVLDSVSLAVGSARVVHYGESDGGGTSNTTGYDITVASGKAPIARCHDVSLQLDASGQASIAASLLDGSGGSASLPSGDLCGTPVTLALDKSAFTCADAGANTVTLTATGNSGLTSTCTATVTVGADDVDPSTPGCAEAVNDPPTLSAPASIAVSEDVPKALTAISFADADAGSDIVEVILTLVGGGRLSVTSDGEITIATTVDGLFLRLNGTVAAINAFFAAGRVTFTPEADDSTDAELAVSIDDLGNNGDGGARSASTTITLAVEPVNDPPAVTVPASIAVTEDTPAAVTGISFADVDADPDPVSVTLAVGGGELAAATGGGVTVGGSATALTLDGTVAAINGFLAANGVTFTPAADDTGTVALTITVDDQGHSGSGGPRTDTATVELLVTPVNDPPVIDAPTDLSLTAGSPHPLQNVAFDDTEAGDLEVLVTLTADGGELAYSSAPAAALAHLTASGPASTLTLLGTIDELNAAFAAGEVTYTAGGPGTFTLTITIDDQGAGTGPPEQTTATVLLDAVALPSIVEVPTLGSWGLLALLALLTGAALHHLRRT